MRHPPGIPSAWPIAGGRISVALVVGTLGRPSAARHVVDLVRGLGAGRHRAHVYVMAGAAPPTAARFEALGVPVTALPRRHAYEPGRLVALARALRRDGVDLVHAILPAGAAYGAFAARLAGIPVVIVSSRADDPRERRRVRTLLHRIYRGATAVLANTRAHAAAIGAEANLSAGRVRVVYDGVDLDGPHPPGVLDGLRDRVWHRPFVIGGAGGGEAGRRLFGAAAVRIAARHPAARFVWLEDGANAGAPAPPADPRVAAFGPVMTVARVGDDPMPVLGQLAMLCLAGAPECPSLDLVPAAMAAARPIVATRVPGIDEFVVDGATGAVVPGGDAAAFAAAALALLDDRGRLRSAGAAARARAERGLGAAEMARATAAVYEASLLGRRAPTGRGEDVPAGPMASLGR
ncbi:MAG: glycosyltransferase [Deltaproteobacteria bacterium]|nr:glycosyltransferase [Deltaproteobacteria bacterium]